MKKTSAAALWRAGALVVFLAAVVILAVVLELPSVDQIRAWTEGAGILGFTGFVVGYALVTLAPVPKTVISIAAGVVWGMAAGVVLVFLGALLGATLAFILGRLLGRDAVERFTGGRVHAIDEMLRRRGLLSVIGVRLIPLIPFTAVNYTAGLTAVRIRDYALGTVIGIIPGTIAYVAVGAYGAELNTAFFVALGVLGFLTVGGLVGANRFRKNQKVSQQKAADPAPEQS